MEKHPEQRKEDFNKHHPEIQDDEVFLYNITKHGTESYTALDEEVPAESHEQAWSRIEWKTKRLGQDSFDIDGKSLPYMRPVFVKRQELIDAGYNPDELGT